MWLRYVFRAIILIAIVLGSYYLWRSQKEKSEASQEALDLAAMIGIRLGESDDGAAELYKILATFHRKEAEGKNVWFMLKEGIDNAENDFLDLARGQLTRSLKDNFTRAQAIGVFDRESNILDMEVGRAPLVLKGPYFSESRDTYAAITHIVSPIFSPESANALPNLIIVPEPVAQIRVEEVNDVILRTASELKSMGALKTETYDLLTRLRRKQREEEDR